MLVFIIKRTKGQSVEYSQSAGPRVRWKTQLQVCFLLWWICYFILEEAWTYCYYHHHYCSNRLNLMWIHTKIMCLKRPILYFDYRMPYYHVCWKPVWRYFPIEIFQLFHLKANCRIKRAYQKIFHHFYNNSLTKAKSMVPVYVYYFILNTRLLTL